METKRHSTSKLLLQPLLLPSPLIVPVQGVFIVAARRTLKRDAHTGRKLNPAVTDDIIELLNESRKGGGGALQQDGIIQPDHSEGQRWEAIVSRHDCSTWDECAVFLFAGLKCNF